MLYYREEQALAYAALAQYEAALAVYNHVGQPLKACAQLLGLIALGGIFEKACVRINGRHSARRSFPLSIAGNAMRHFLFGVHRNSILITRFHELVVEVFLANIQAVHLRAAWDNAQIPTHAVHVGHEKLFDSQGPARKWQVAFVANDLSAVAIASRAVHHHLLMIVRDVVWVSGLEDAPLILARSRPEANQR